MRTELVFPSQVEPNDRLLIDDQIISVVGAFPIGMIQTQIDYFDESARPGTLVVGPFDVLTREVHSND
jgi:hypothetical protein|nr:MAG TPA: hypothetical protein [Caudoviricetes sp.]